MNMTDTELDELRESIAANQARIATITRMLKVPMDDHARKELEHERVDLRNRILGARAIGRRMLRDVHSNSNLLQ